MDTLGKMLRQARQSAGLSQTESARQVGVTQQAISSWENGKDAPGYDHLVRAAEVYRVDSEPLLEQLRRLDRAGDPRTAAWSHYVRTGDRIRELSVERTAAMDAFLQHTAAEVAEEFNRIGVSAYLAADDAANNGKNVQRETHAPVLIITPNDENYTYRVQVIAPLRNAGDRATWVFATCPDGADGWVFSWVHADAAHYLLVPAIALPVPGAPAGRATRQDRLRLIQGTWQLAGRDVTAIVDQVGPDNVRRFWREALHVTHFRKPKPD